MTRLATNFVIAAVLTLTSGATVQAQAVPWYFGMNVALRYSPQYESRVLQVVSVVPGSPASRAGLQPGDKILLINGRDFNNAQNDYMGRAILQDATSNPRGGVPTAGLGTYVVTQPGTARMQVIDINSGELTPVVCYAVSSGTPVPTYIGGGNCSGRNDGTCQGGGNGGGVPTVVTSTQRTTGVVSSPAKNNGAAKVQQSITRYLKNR